MRSTSGAYGPTLSGQGRTYPDGVDRATRRRVIAASFIGNFVEWFDYAVYGYLATTIAVVSSPKATARWHCSRRSHSSPSASSSARSAGSSGVTSAIGSAGAWH
nr:hypothetical protein GCM10023233_13970 [Brevibacterium otitidis]